MPKKGRAKIALFLILLLLGTVFFLLRPKCDALPVGASGENPNPVSSKNHSEKKKKEGNEPLPREKREGPIRKEISDEVYCFLHVVEKATRRPLGGAAVYKNPSRVVPNRKWAKRLGFTDKEGIFNVFKGLLSPGREILFVSKEGYQPEVVPGPDEGKSIFVTLEKGSTLEIILVKPDGKPVPNIPVAVSSYMSVKGKGLIELAKGRPIPGIPTRSPFVHTAKSNRAGRCFFHGLNPKTKYGVWVLTRAMTAIDRRPMVPSGDSGKMVITLAPLFGVWAEFKGDVFVAGGPKFSQAFEKRLFYPFFLDFSFITGRSDVELEKSLFCFVVPQFRKNGNLKAGLPEGVVPCEVLLAKKGLVTVPLKMRRVTPGLSPQVVDVSHFPDDPSMGKVLLSLRNYDGSPLPFTEGHFYLELRRLKGGEKGEEGKKWEDYLWTLSRKPYFIPEGKYKIQFPYNSLCRMFREYLAEESRIIHVEGGKVNRCTLKMKRQLVPLRFKFFGPRNAPVSFGLLKIYPSDPENLSKRFKDGKDMVALRGFVQFCFRAWPKVGKMEDMVCYAPEGKEVIVKFQPEPAYGLEDFEERMVFYRKPGIHVVERYVGGKK